MRSPASTGTPRLGTESSLPAHRRVAKWEQWCGVCPPPRGGGTGPRAWVLPGTWKMPVPWFLLSLALGRSPVVLSLERLVGPQDVARCSPVSLGPWEGWRLLRIWFVSH